MLWAPLFFWYFGLITLVRVSSLLWRGTVDNFFSRTKWCTSQWWQDNRHIDGSRPQVWGWHCFDFSDYIVKGNNSNPTWMRRKSWAKNEGIAILKHKETHALYNSDETTRPCSWNRDQTTKYQLYCSHSEYFSWLVLPVFLDNWVSSTNFDYTLIVQLFKLFQIVEEVHKSHNKFSPNSLLYHHIYINSYTLPPPSMFIWSWMFTSILRCAGTR